MDQFGVLHDQISSIIGLKDSVKVFKNKFSWICRILQQIDENLSLSCSDNGMINQIYMLLSEFYKFTAKSMSQEFHLCLLQNHIGYTIDFLDEFVQEITSITNLTAQFEDCNHNERDKNDFLVLLDIVKEMQNNSCKFSSEEILHLQTQEKFIEELIDDSHSDNIHSIKSQIKIDEELNPFSSKLYQHSDFKKIKMIGDVYKAIQISTGLEVAMKEMKVHKMTFEVFQTFKREISILYNLDHYALLPFVGAIATVPFTIITEFMPNGSVKDYLKQQSHLIDPTVLTIVALGVAKGMEFLHSKKYIHRDIKSLNILLDSDNYPKICDFGSSRSYVPQSSMMTGGIGTSQWMAPEVILSQPYDEKADVYSYGMLLWEMVTHEIPFQGMRDIQVAMEVINQNRRPDIPPQTPHSLKSLIEKCWHRDPKVRPSFQEISQLFESGEIEYQNTDRERVIEYLEKNKESEITVQDIIRCLKSPKQANLAFKKIVNFEGNMNNEELISLIKERIEHCSSNNQAYLMSRALAKIFEDENIMKKFIKDFELIENLFNQFPLPIFFDILHQIFNNQVIALKEDTLTNMIKIFEMSSNETKKSFIDLIKKLNGSNSDFCIKYFSNFLSCETESTLLISILQLFQNMKVNELNKFIVLLNSQDRNVVSTTLNIINSNIEQAKPEFIKDFIQNVPSLFNRNYEFPTLCIIAKQIRRKEILKNNELLWEVLKCLDSQDIQILVATLKIIFFYEINGNISERMIPSIISYAYHGNESVSLLALADLIVLLKKYNFDYDEHLLDFITNHIDSNDPLYKSILRLIGVLCSSNTWTDSFVESLVFQSLAQHIPNSSKEEKELIIIIFTKCSASHPFLECFLDSVPFVVCELSNPSIRKNVITFMSNITINPEGAKQCGKHISQLVKVLKISEKEEVSSVLDLIRQIVKTPEASSSFDNTNVITKLILTTESFWTTDHVNICFEIYESLSVLDQAKTAITQSSIPNFISSNMNSNPTLKPYFLRILSRTRLYK